MSGKRYTLTIYVAAPGTPLNDERGNPKITKGIREHSVFGHVYYAIDDGTGKKGFGFAPLKDGHAIGRGAIKKYDFKTYQNPVYERTIEISKEQYDRLLAFGANPKIGGFDHDIYSGIGNNCITAAHVAFRYAGIHNFVLHTPPMPLIGRPISPLVEDNGYVRVEENIKNFEKIKPLPQYKNSELNKTIRRPKPNCDSVFKDEKVSRLACRVASTSDSVSSYLDKNPITQSEMQNFAARVESVAKEQQAHETRVVQSITRG